MWVSAEAPTNDGGVGMLQALGYAFLDKNGKQVLPGARGLKDITEITDAYVIPELAECKFRVACDVTNPLCGELDAVPSTDRRRVLRRR